MYFCNKDGDEKLYYVFYYFGIFGILINCLFKLN